LPTRTEELREQFRALFAAQTRENFRAMIEARMPQQIGDGASHSRLVVPCAKHHAIHAREQNRAGAHRARLERDIQRAALESPRIQRRRSGPNHQRLGVRRRILIAQRSVPRAREHFARTNYHRANGNLARRLRGARFVERDANPTVVVGMSELHGLRPPQFPSPARSRTRALPSHPAAPQSRRRR